MSYNPKPTRVWSRVQHPCTFTLDSSYNSVFSALTGKTTSPLEADYYNKLLYKGNILQYKKNTSNLTKSQRYSQICKGMWTNRTKTFATQTQTYTNPNTSNLKRVNFIRVPTNGNTTYIHGPYNFNIPAPNGCISDSIKDGGSLLCNTTVNPCTNEVIEITKVLECYPTSCSDVPGPIIDLCWNSKIDTWYPKQNLTMPTSGTKWPEGYKGFVSAVKPYAPFLSLLSLIGGNATLSWNVVNNDCIPISSYNIYENGRLIANVPYPTDIYNYTVCGVNTFYITSISGTTESEPSNTITVTFDIIPLVLTAVNNNNNTATLSWTINSSCNISQFKIYNDSTGSQIGSVNYPTNTFIVPLIVGDNYFYVTAISGGNESGQSNIVNVNNPLFFTTGISNYLSGYYYITFTTNGTITFNSTITNASIICVGGGGGGGSGVSFISANVSGRGGGGGGNYQITSQTLTSGSYSITVGQAGTAGQAGTFGGAGTPGGAGGISSVNNPLSTTILQCSGGGGGGSGGPQQPGGPAGPGGTVTIGGSGGNGGNGGENAPGGNSSSFTSQFAIPLVLSGIINSIYCGGGGGSSTGQNGGAAGLNGVGGAEYGSSSKNGGNASSYGSGGGGAGDSGPPSLSNFPGGSGGAGVVIFYFLYP